MRSDPVLPALVTREMARAAGLTDKQIDHRIASGAWVAQRRGRLLTSPGDESAPWEVVAAWSSIRRRTTTVSHSAAARWWQRAETARRVG